MPFARWLARLVDGPGTSPLLDAVRDFVEATYPVGPGEDVLGRPCRRRRVHSVMTASREHGVNWTRMQRTIRAIADHPGFAGLPAPSSNLCFPADAYDPWLGRYAGSLGPKAAAKRLGVHVEFVKQMTDRGWLRPVVSLPGLVDRYDPVELRDILDELLGQSQLVSRLEVGTALVLSACMKCACDAVGILELIHAKRLSFVGRLEGRHGIGSIVIRPRGVLDALEGPKLEGYRQDDLRRLLGVNSSTASWVVRTGVIRSTVRLGHRSRKPASVVTHADLKAFQAEHLPLGTIARAQGTLPKHAAARLARRGILPLVTPPRCSQLYRRADVENG